MVLLQAQGKELGSETGSTAIPNSWVLFLRHFSQVPKAEENLDSNAFEQAAVFNKRTKIMLKKLKRSIFNQPPQLSFVTLNFYFIRRYPIFKIFQGIWSFVSKYGEI